MPDFQTITQLIPKLGAHLEDPPSPTADQNKILQIFENILGNSARFIQPILFRSGRLNVYAEAAVWGQHIQHRHEKLMDLFKHAGLQVTEIKVSIRPNVYPKPNKHKKRSPNYNVNTVSNHLEQFASQIDDDELSRSVTRLAKRVRRNSPSNQQDD